MRPQTLRPLDPTQLPSIPSAVAAARRNPELAAAGAQILERVASELSRQLGAPLSLQAKLLDTPVRLDSARHGCCYLSLTLSRLGESALLELELGLAAALVDRLAGGPGELIAPISLSEPEHASIAFLALCALRSARDVAPVEETFAARLDGFVTGHDEWRELREQSWIAIDVLFGCESASGAGRLLLTSRSVERAARLMPRQPGARPPAPPFHPATLAASLELKTRLESSSCSGLDVGDVVLLTEAARREACITASASLAFDGFSLRGRLHGGAFEFHELLEEIQEDPMDAASSHPPLLPVPVVIELSKVRVPLSELGELKAGTVLELHQSLHDLVILRVGDRAFARAELVDVDGELGARIVSLLS